MVKLHPKENINNLPNRCILKPSPHGADSLLVVCWPTQGEQVTNGRSWDYSNVFHSCPSLLALMGIGHPTRRASLLTRGEKRLRRGSAELSPQTPRPGWNSSLIEEWASLPPPGHFAGHFADSACWPPLWYTQMEYTNTQIQRYTHYTDTLVLEIW